MLSDAFRRTAVLVSLVAVLTTPYVSAAGSGIGGVRPAQVESASPGFLDLALSFFQFAGSGPLYLKTGCKLDTDGRCHTAVARPPYTKTGCKLDPNGHCLS